MGHASLEYQIYGPIPEPYSDGEGTSDGTCTQTVNAIHASNPSLSLHFSLSTIFSTPNLSAGGKPAMQIETESRQREIITVGTLSIYLVLHTLQTSDHHMVLPRHSPPCCYSRTLSGEAHNRPATGASSHA